MAQLEKLTKIPELIKIENSLFALPFVYIGVLLAGSYTIVTFILVTMALMCARGAAFSMNRYVGREHDIKNPKKKDWASISLYSKNELLVVFGLFTIVFLASAYLLNIFALTLAPLILLLIIIEPYLKRYTSHRHLIMGLIIGLGILGGYIGAKGAFPTTWPIYVLLFGYMFYSAANDIIYTMNHVAFDKENGLKTYPASFGAKNALIISYNYHCAAAASFVLFGLLNGSIAIVLAGFAAYLIFVMEHEALDKNTSLASTFFNYNALVSVLLLVSVISFKLMPMLL